VLGGVAHAGSSLRTTVLHVVDGDTIRVQLPGGPTAVRLIGIDAPEEHESDRLDRAARSNHRSKGTIQALGRLASEFTRRQLLGRSVSLELDVEDRDRYGRLLAYVWLDERTLFNAEIVRAGYATAYTVPPNVRYAEWFRALEREARTERRGLWSRGLAEATPRRRPAAHRHHAGAHPPRAARISFASRAKIPGPSLPSEVSTWTAFAPLASARRTS